METLKVKNGFFVLLGLTLINAACSPVEFKDGKDYDAFYLSDPTDPMMMKYTESYTQATQGGKIDILIVDDNSGSMVPKQTKMGQRIQSFLSKIHDIDWQIGITTTDISDGPFGMKGSFLPLEGASGNILRPSTPNAESVFLNTIVREETINCSNSACPSGDEQGLKASIMAMQKRNSNNAGFFREDSKLAILEISDEDERSDGTPADTTQGSEVMAALNQIWGGAKSLTFFALIVQPGDTACKGPDSDAAHYGNVLAAFATLTGGFTGSICASDYGAQLEAIGDSVRYLVKSYQLQKAPQAGTFRIKFDPPQPQVQFELQGAHLVYLVPPDKGTVVSIQYIAPRD